MGLYHILSNSGTKLLAFDNIGYSIDTKANRFGPGRRNITSLKARDFSMAVISKRVRDFLSDRVSSKITTRTVNIRGQICG